MIQLSDEEADVFRRLLEALGTARDQFVIAGGQASRLLRLHPLARELEWKPLLTGDVDVASHDKGLRSGVDVGEALQRAGFAPRLDGDDVPPLTHYVRGGLEIELIVPDVPRRKATGATVSVLGASAQKVADLEPLLVEPIELEVPNVGQVRVPNPGAYILQKALTLSARRNVGKKGKDALYVHDALQLFTKDAHLQPEVIAMAKRVHDTLTKKQQKRLEENIEKLSDPGTDFVAEAARQAAGRPGTHTAEAIALANRLGFRELLAAK